VRKTRSDDTDREVLLGVIETGSLSAAARRLGTTTSAVSKRLAKLEARLGVRLVNRSSRRLSPTQAGRRFYERCRRLSDELSDAEREARALGAELRGALRVGVPYTFGQQHLVPLLPEFLDAHPAMDFALVADDRYGDVIEAGLDLVIRTGLPGDSRLKQRKLADDPRVVCASPLYLARRGEPRTPSELAGHAFMRHAYQRPAGRIAFEGPDGDVLVAVRGRVEANHTGMIRDLALAGAGIALLPRFAIVDELAAGTLRVLLDDWRVTPGTAIYALFPDGKQPAPALRAFVAHLAARLPARLATSRAAPARSGAAPATPSARPRKASASRG
jgi:DNA-binding transcriptional LysR family regulator